MPIRPLHIKRWRAMLAVICSGLVAALIWSNQSEAVYQRAASIPKLVPFKTTLQFSSAFGKAPGLAAGRNV